MRHTAVFIIMANTITALKQQKRNPDRVNVFLDGEFAFGLTKIVAAWLKLGQSISSEKIDELRSENEVEQAYQRALNFISYRPRSTMEVARKLRKHKISEELIEDVIDRLQEKKILDDANFARLWVENRNDFRPRGRYALRSELRQKGLSEAHIEQALQDLDEEQLARLAAERKVRHLINSEWNDFRSKLSAYLSRRGFEYALIAEICKESWETVQSGEHITT